MCIDDHSIMVIVVVLVILVVVIALVVVVILVAVVVMVVLVALVARAHDDVIFITEGGGRACNFLFCPW